MIPPGYILVRPETLVGLQKAVEAALGVVNANLIRYAQASLERGAAGIFLSVPASAESLTVKVRAKRPDEATSRLRRLALCYRGRLAGLSADELDAPCASDPGAWTIRQIVHHVAGITAYAELLGPLA